MTLTAMPSPRAWLTGIAGAGLLLGVVFGAAAGNKPLSLDEVLVHADQPHPDLDIARAQGELASAELALAESQNDLNLTFIGSLRGGRNPILQATGEDFSGDNYARLNLRKTLWDAGRYEGGLEAARLEQMGREHQLRCARAQRRMTLLARYFDVLTTDLQYAADNEYMAVAYVNLDDNRERQRLGQISSVALAEIESRYEEQRLKRNDTLRRARDKRAQLASAMNRPGEMPGELADPDLARYNRPLPDFDTLHRAMLEANPRLLAHRQLLAASTQRLNALRAEGGPSLEFEAEAATYERNTLSRDEFLAGLNLVWPLYQGKRVDSRQARELAQHQLLQAQYERMLLDFRQLLRDTREEIELILDSERRAAERYQAYRDTSLERARAEYELELKTNLGTSMAETQVAKLRRRALDFRLALAWERLATLLGATLETLPGSRAAESDPASGTDARTEKNA
jgi:outer membrane protein TolC